MANLFIIFAPAPSYKMHSKDFNGADMSSAVASEFQSSQTLFVVASWMQSLGAGATPAMQSLALCIVQARSLLAAEAGQSTAAVDAGTGSLFGALSVLQAAGQMVLGVSSDFFSRLFPVAHVLQPLLFGLVYSGTVASFPKTVFVTAIAILFAALTAIMLVRSPLSEDKGKAVVRRRRQINSLEEEQRGRSRVSKDLRGYGSTQQGSPNASSSSGSV